MKLEITPFGLLAKLIREHKGKHTEDDERATMLAIWPGLVQTVGADFARTLIQHPQRREIYRQVLQEMNLPLRYNATTKGTKPEPQKPPVTAGPSSPAMEIS